MHKMLMGAAAAAALTMIAGAASAQAPAAAPAPPPAPMKVTQIKPGLFVVDGGGGNSTIRIGKDALLLVDTKNPGDAVHAELLQNIRSVTQLPVKEVVVTHHHADHSGGIGNFEAEGATVTTNVGLSAQLDKGYTGGGGFKPSKPTKTYDKTAEVKINGATARLYHFDPGHTGGDTLVYFPDLKVLSGGDEIVAIAPNIDFPYGGSLLGLQDSLSQVAKLDSDTVIPGHGASSVTRAQFDDYRKKIDTLVARAKASAKAGTPKEQFLASIKTDDIGWNITTPQWTPAPRLDALYAEMSK